MMKRQFYRLGIILIIALFLAFIIQYSSLTKSGFINQYLLLGHDAKIIPQDKPFTQLALAAEKRTLEKIYYDGAYVAIPYPMGDIDKTKGVCTDVVIRSYRALGIDLQELVHEDMKESFLLYPKIWALTKPDTNIDHRRVPNLMTFFNRRGASVVLSDKANDYKAGDIVAWDIGFATTHIGIVSTKKSADGTPLIVHNIGRGPELEDCLFYYEIIGHYRYFEGSDRAY